MCMNETPVALFEGGSVQSIIKVFFHSFKVFFHSFKVIFLRLKC